MPATSELIQPTHLQRQAIIYVRQSSPHQQILNQESLRLQYALKQRAVALGWHEAQVEVIDADLGRTGSTAQGRAGFNDLVGRVNLGQVGVIFAYDVTRLSRNCSDWYQLLDLCGFRGCLIADHDAVYDPSSINGRLLLGLKGQISELELHTIRARLIAGLTQKAERGELTLRLPAGYVRDELGRVLKHPDQEVQDRLALVFSTFLRLRSACRVTRYFVEQKLLLPRGEGGSAIAWRRPTVSSVLGVLRNPAYAGAYVYGRTRFVPQRGDPSGRRKQPLPMDQWKVVLHDRLPAYIDWETFIRIQAMIADNHSHYQGNTRRGVPRPGKALLHGIIHCGECGRQMTVSYKTGVRYLCHQLKLQQLRPLCQRLPADPIDEAVVAAFWQALAPAELDLLAGALAEVHQEQEGVLRAHEQQVERLRYLARLAERQFNQVDPDNRLVAAELERRWEAALRELRAAEQTLEQQRQRQQARQQEIGPAASIPDELRRQWAAAGCSLPELWQQGGLKPEHKKALLRCLIDKVVLKRVAPDSVQARVVWKGGDVTELAVSVPVRDRKLLAGNAALEAAVVEQARAGRTDEEIAADLTQEGYRSARALKVSVELVQSIRLAHGIRRDQGALHRRRIAGWLTVDRLARRLEVAAGWIYAGIESGAIRVRLHEEHRRYLFPDTPETLTLFRQLHEGKRQQLDFTRG